MTGWWKTDADDNEVRVATKADAETALTKTKFDAWINANATGATANIANIGYILASNHPLKIDNERTASKARTLSVTDGDSVDYPTFKTTLKATQKQSAADFKKDEDNLLVDLKPGVAYRFSLIETSDNGEVGYKQPANEDKTLIFGTTGAIRPPPVPTNSGTAAENDRTNGITFHFQDNKLCVPEG